MTFVDVLLDWYDQNARALPWRSLESPYRTWISEIMLQQTQVDTVIPYFERWMRCFPTIESLAKADEQAVLVEWEGLGYYSRARNLYQTAVILVSNFDGKLPETREKLEKLPGIGPYTAAAIASIAFKQDVAAVDGNIRRVFSRVFNLTETIRSSAFEKQVRALAEEHLPAGKAGDYNQALMDLGATICTPKTPACHLCPVSDYCESFRLGVQEERPLSEPRKTLPHLTVTAAVIHRDGEVLLAQRPRDGLLGGLWEFPGGTYEKDDEDLQACLRREIREELDVGIRIDGFLGVYKHAYTHYRISLHAFLCTLLDGQEPRSLEGVDLVWATPGQLKDYPMGKVDRRISRKINREGWDEPLSK